MIRPAVVSVVTVALLALAGSALPQNVPPSPNEQRQGRGNTQGTQPPIHVTVEAPKPDPTIAEQEQRNREREIEIQTLSVAFNDRIADYTRALAWITGFQLLASFLAFFAAIRAATAAKRSADTAHVAFSESRVPYMDVERWTAGWHLSQYMGVKPVYGFVNFAVVNFGTTTAILERVELSWAFGDEPPQHQILERQTPLGPQRDFEVVACEPPLTDEQTGLVHDDNGLVLKVWGRIYYRGLTDKESSWRTFGRFVILRFRSYGRGDEMKSRLETTFRLFEVPGFYREGRGVDTLPLAAPKAANLAKWESMKDRQARAEQQQTERRAQKEADKNQKNAQLNEPADLS